MKTVLLTNFESSKIKLEILEDTQYVVVPTDEISIEFIPKRPGITVEVLVLYVSTGTQRVFVETKSSHLVPNTKCEVLVKAVLKHSSKSTYIGKIFIDKPAQGTISYLEDSVLVLGEATSNSAQPILEILADDVKASHGATTGRIDESTIYYLMSRGLSRLESEGQIVTGFMESALSKIYDVSIAHKVKELLNV